MNKCYVFAIGGSGARVVKALSFLLASGYKYPELKGRWEIVPILMDMDAQNAAYIEALDLLRLYSVLQNELFSPQGESAFFQYKISSLDDKSNSFAFNVKPPKGDSLKDILHYAELSHTTQKFVDLLYRNRPLSESKQDALTMDLNVGFKGVPSIGNVVLQQTLDGEAFHRFVSKFADGDRVFLIGSIFGGTGAAGLPLIAKAIRNADEAGQNRANGQALANAPIGALLIKPYFKVNSGSEDVAIKSDSFILKTKAALKYYAQNAEDISATYYLADDSATSYEYCEGGQKQNNHPHIVEFAGALSLFEFLKEDEANFEGESRGFEFGLNAPATASNFTIKSFDDVSRKALERSFIPFYYLRYLVKHEWEALRKKEAAEYFKEGGFAKQILQSDFAERLTKFMAAFDEWTDGLGKSSPTFTPFVPNPGDCLNELIPAYSIKKSNWIGKDVKLDLDDFIKCLNKSKGKGERDAKHLIKIYDTGIRKFIDEHNFIS